MNNFYTIILQILYGMLLLQLIVLLEMLDWFESARIVAVALKIYCWSIKISADKKNKEHSLKMLLELP